MCAEVLNLVYDMCHGMEKYYICRAEDPDDCSEVSKELFSRVYNMVVLSRMAYASEKTDGIELYVESGRWYILHVVRGKELSLSILYI